MINTVLYGYNKSKHIIDGISLIVPKDFITPGFCKEYFYNSDLKYSMICSEDDPRHWLFVRGNDGQIIVSTDYDCDLYKRIEIPYEFSEGYDDDYGCCILDRFLKLIENFKVRNYIISSDIGGIPERLLSNCKKQITVPINTILPSYINDIKSGENIIKDSLVFYESINFNTTHSYDEVINDIMKLNKDNTSFTIYYSPND
jgi:hypothetical protein